MRKLALLAATAMLAASPVLAQTQTQTQQRTTTQPTQSHPGTTTTTTTSRTEAVSTPEFVRMATISDMYEIQAAQMAEQRSQNQQVKQFAQRMVTDHTKVSNQMKQAVQQASGSLGNVQMPTSLDQKHQALLQQLQQAQGAQFDQTYIQQQVQAHQMAVDMFRNYAQSGDNAQLKQLASQTLPTLQQHLQMAQELQRTMHG